MVEGNGIHVGHQEPFIAQNRIVVDQHCTGLILLVHPLVLVVASFAGLLLHLTATSSTLSGESQ